MKKIFSKKIFLGFLTIAVTMFLFYGIFAYYTEGQIRALGYSINETSQIIDEHGTLSAYNITKEELELSIAEKEAHFTDVVGDSLDTIVGKEGLSLVEYDQLLDIKIETRTSFYTIEIANLTTTLDGYPIEEEDVIDYTGYTLAAEYSKKTELATKYTTYFDDKLAGLRTSLIDLGLRESEVDALVTGDVHADIATLEGRVTYMEEYNALVSTSGNNYAAGAMDLFNRLSDHRVANGLPPFRYNAEGQSCVDIEANSYANNQNPHNWLCKDLTSEGSSLSSVNSDYITIAGDFLTSHDSHERDVLMPEYVSAACSAVESDGMVYMICGYFTY